MERRRIIIDTDPGCDDAVAMLLAFASPELEVLGITTIMGNTTLAQVTVNALKVCELAGRTAMPVYAGCELPLLQKLETAEMVHGRDGMAELDLPAPGMRARDQHAADYIVETVLAHPQGAITLCALGALTNIALAIAKDRRVARRLDSVVIMGGSFFAGGNSSVPPSETNFYVDPHAARIVLESGARLVLAPLDLTHRSLATPARIASFRGTHRVLNTVADIMEFYSRYDVEKMGLAGGPIHDPCVIVWLLKPELFTAKEVFVEIESESPRSLGMSIMDWWGVTGRPPNATVLHDLDSDGFYRLLADRVATL